MEEAKFYNKIKHIEAGINVLVDTQRVSDDIGSVRLDHLINAIERHIPRNNGIICSSEDCVFNITYACGLRQTNITKGKCLNYSPNLKHEDIINTDCCPKHEG